MSRRRFAPWVCRTAGLAMSIAMAPLALADVPPALDRVPADAPVVVAMKNVKQFSGGVHKLADTLKVPAEAMAGMKHVTDMLETPGLNADGSAAVAVLALDKGDDDEKGPIVMVVPVNDYAAFVKALGGKGEGLEEVKVQDEPVYVKDLGGGFAAVGPVKDLVDKFAGKAGSGKSFETLMGATGNTIAEGSDAFVLANMEKVGPGMKEKMDDGLDMASAMAAQNAAQVEMVKGLVDNFFRDAQSGIIGLKMTDGGSKLDFGAQFKEGSELAKNFAAKGNASKLVSSLPNIADGFLFAVAVDTSSAGLKSFFKGMAEAAQKNPETAKVLSGLNPLQQIEKIDGMGFIMGKSPALMGGVFLNTSAFVKTSDPAGYIKTAKDAMTTMNGKTIEGITYATAYESGGGKVGDKAVDSWSLKMQMDPNNPAAQQMAQMQMMMFGPNGLNGYIAQAEGGVVMTYSKNGDLMSQALQAAAGGDKGLGGDAGVKAVQANLPAGRTAEAYIGIKSILETAQGFMGMMGGGGGNFVVPQDLPPVGIGGTTDSGGVRASIYVPTQVMTTIKGFAESVKGGEGGEGGDDMDADKPKKDENNKKSDKTGQPKF